MQQAHQQTTVAQTERGTCLKGRIETQLLWGSPEERAGFQLIFSRNVFGGCAPELYTELGRVWT